MSDDTPLNDKETDWRHWLRTPLAKNTITTAIVVIMVLLSAFYVNITSSAAVMPIIISLGSLGALVYGYANFLFRWNSELIDHAVLNLTVTSIFLGATLAFLVSLLFLSGLLSGSLFPEITSTDENFTTANAALRTVTLKTNGDFYKLLVWSFLAGFSQEAVLKRVRGFSSNFSTAANGQ